jgi:hypothetical protein
MSFPSRYWADAAIPADDVAALAQLFDPAAPEAARHATLDRLLAAASPATRGIALDFFSVSAASRRHGRVPVVDDAIAVAVRACALRELAAPPTDPEDPSHPPFRGANHASALHALWFKARASDAYIVASILADHPAPAVVAAAVALAEPVLRGEPAHPALIDALWRVVDQHDLPPRIRRDAIMAIAGVDDPVVEPGLAAAAGCDELDVAAAAARGLLARDLVRHKPAVTRLAARWPADDQAPFDVVEVRRLLEE